METRAAAAARDPMKLKREEALELMRSVRNFRKVAEMVGVHETNVRK